MKKKMIWIIGVVVAVLVVVMGVILISRYVRLKNTVPLDEFYKEESVQDIGPQMPGSVSELIAEVESEEEAKQIAEQYGITLKEVNGTLAIFETTEDPLAVRQRGSVNGWKKLDINDIYYLEED